MATSSMKQPENIYFRCRKEAAKHNLAVSTREKTAELLNISVSTLANYELGVTKNVPVECVARMAELYNAPEIKNTYCATECPIGKNKPIAFEITSIERVALRLLRQIEDNSIESFRSALIEVALQGSAKNDGERLIYEALIERIDELMIVLSELRMLGEKCLKG